MGRLPGLADICFGFMASSLFRFWAQFFCSRSGWGTRSATSEWAEDGEVRRQFG